MDCGKYNNMSMSIMLDNRNYSYRDVDTENLSSDMDSK